MSETRKRLLILCSRRSVRALMAASMLAAWARERWDVWSTPVVDGPREFDLARQVLDEIGVPLLMTPQTSEPMFGLSWDEGIVLCSGLADT